MIKESAENISGADIPMIEMICQQVPATLGKTENHLADKNDLEVINESKVNPIKSKPQHTYMSEYDMERFAIECNAYVVCEERKKVKNNREKSKKMNSIPVLIY